MDLDRRAHRSATLPPQFDLGSAPRLAADRSSSQRAAFQERKHFATAFSLRADFFLHPLELPLWLGGFAWLFATKEGKHFRFLAWAYVIVLAIFISMHGKSYYPLPFYPMLIAAGGVAFERFVAAPNRRWLAFAFPALVIVGGLATVPFGVPFFPSRPFCAIRTASPHFA